MDTLPVQSCVSTVTSGTSPVVSHLFTRGGLISSEVVEGISLIEVQGEWGE